MIKRMFGIIIALSILSAFLPAFTIPALAAAETDEAFYSYLMERVLDYEEKIDVSSFAKQNRWTLDDVSSRLQQFYLQEPSLFFINNRRILIQHNEQNYLYQIQFEYLYNKSRTKKMAEEMEKAAAKAIEGITDEMSEAEKALAVHDYLVAHNSYDHSMKKYSAYNCLVNQSSTCQGYALAYIYIMRDLLGMECSVVISDTQNHSWNYLKVDGKWYHVDLTADDLSFSTYGGTEYDGFGEVCHNNLLLSDSACKKTTDLHKNWKTFGYPAADSKKYDGFFWQESRSPFVYLDGLWYCVTTDPDSPGANYKKGGSHKIGSQIFSYRFSSGEKNLVKEMDSVWYVYRDLNTGKKLEKKSWYKRSFMKLALCGGELYLNTADQVYRLDPETGKAKSVYTLKKTNMKIFSIAAESDGTLKICYKYDLSYKDKYMTLKV